MYNNLLPTRIAGGFMFRLIQAQQTKVHNKKSPVIKAFHGLDIYVTVKNPGIGIKGGTGQSMGITKRVFYK